MTIQSYEAAGVSVEQGDRFVERLKGISRREGHQKLLPAAGGYAAVYPIAGERCVALTTDGVGTKVLLAHRYQMHRNVGIDLVAMCANDLICVGAQPTLFLDYYATGKLDIETGAQLIEGIVEGCDQAEMLLVGGETAEMPDVYQAGHYDLAGFAVGEVTTDRLLTGQNVLPGQTVIGLASSGIHSNGLSLARKILTTDDALMRLLEPTRIYVKPVMAALKAFPTQITGIAHITGGGWRNLFRLNPAVGFHISQPLPLLPVFEDILSKGIAAEEAYKTFNMGLGMAITVSADAERIAEFLGKSGFTAQIIGKVSAESGMMTIAGQAFTLNPS